MAKKKKARKKKYCGGNFRRPTPQVAAAFIKRWAKHGVRSANDLKVGLGGLKNEKAVKLAQIKFGHAEDVMVDFSKRLSDYEGKHATYQNAFKQWKDCKAKGINLAGCGVKPTAPGKPTGKSHSVNKPPRKCAGNFKTPAKKNAKSYLKRFFGQFNAEVAKFVPTETGVFNMAGALANMSTKNFVPKVREAMEIVGAAESAKIAKDAIANAQGRAILKLDALAEKIAKAGARATKAEKKLAGKAEAAKKRLEAAKERVAKDQDKLRTYLSRIAPERKAKKAKKAKKGKKAAAKPRRLMRRRRR